jgi:hypothetical protein
MEKTRWAKGSRNEWSTLPACRGSRKQPDMLAINSQRRSAAFNSTAPPSELPCRWSNSTITGLAKISGNNKHSFAVESIKRKPLYVPKHCLVNMFVAQNAFANSGFTNNAG